MSGDAIDIGSRRELMVDDHLIDSMTDGSEIVARMLAKLDTYSGR